MANDIDVHHRAYSFNYCLFVSINYKNAYFPMSGKLKEAGHVTTRGTILCKLQLIRVPIFPISQYLIDILHNFLVVAI